MAQKVQVQLVDDLDGSEAGETIRFGLDGAEYEIDLNPVHAGELRAVLVRHIDAGRRAGVTARRARRSRSGGAVNGDIRGWAREQGIEVKDRGRIPAEVVTRFQAAAQ